MLRVLTLSSLFPDAGRPTFGLFVERQTRGLARQPGVEVKVVAPLGLPPWPLSRHARYRGLVALPPRETWRGLDVFRPRFPLIPVIGGRFSPALMARALLPLLHRIRAEFPFDVIDAEFFYPDGPAAARLAPALGLPFSIKARGSDVHYWGAQPGCREVILAAGRSASGLLAVSGALKRDMIAMGMPGERIAVHYTGVDLDAFRPVDRRAAKAALGISGPLILTVGYLIARKGQALVIEALRDLPDATLLIVGEGPDRALLESQIATLGLNGRVRMLGGLAHEALPALYAAADLVALPSASEGLANVWVEALASGTPVIACDVGGARELIDRPEAGRIVERNPQAIVAAVRALLAEPPAQESVRASAARFTWDANAAALHASLSALVPAS